MLDVLHYFFEEDFAYTTAEEAESRSNLRTELYLLYGKTYNYPVSSSESSGNGGRKYVSPEANFDLDLPTEFSPKERKPYVPATDFNPDSAMPFGSILDAPIG